LRADEAYVLYGENDYVDCIEEQGSGIFSFDFSCRIPVPDLTQDNMAFKINRVKDGNYEHPVLNTVYFPGG